MYIDNLNAKISKHVAELDSVQKCVLEKGWYNAIYWNYTESAFMLEYKLELLRYIINNQKDSLEKVLKFLEHEKNNFNFNDKNKERLEILQIKVIKELIDFFNMHTEIF